MKCPVCHKHWKHVGNLDHVDSVCPDCFVEPAGNTELKKLFEEILVRHVALTELREIYRHKLDTILKNAQKQAF